MNQSTEREQAKLRSAALTVAVRIIFFFVLALPALFLGLAALLSRLSTVLTLLSGLATLLALARLIALLAFLFHIVRH
jgi:hypothetical protein